MDTQATTAEAAVLNFVPLIPIAVLWVIGMRHIAPIQSKPIRLALILLRIAKPILFLYL